jgi:hypothetical protein
LKLTPLRRKTPLCPKTSISRKTAPEIENPCAVCGCPIFQRRPDAIYCSKRCAWVASRDRSQERACPCGASFRSLFKNQRYCSISCTSKRNPDNKVKSRVCKQCRSEFTSRWRAERSTNQKFCSVQCLRKFEACDTVSSTCDTCGSSIVRSRTRFNNTKRHYCSTECRRKGNRGENAGGWRGGVAVGRNGFRGRGWLKIRDTIRERDKYTCRRCGKHESDNNGRKLSVDHVVAFRNFETDEAANDPENLVALCTSCHSHKTHGVERRFVSKGDMVSLDEFRRSIELPSLVPKDDGEDA